MNYSEANLLALIEHYGKYGDLIFLDSQKHDHPSSEKSYLAAKPYAWIKSKGLNTTLFEDGEIQTVIGNPWKLLSEFRIKHKEWLFGYLGYDLKNYIENLVSQNEALNYSAPDMFFMVPEFILEISKDNINLLKGNLEEVHGPKSPSLRYKLGLSDKNNQKTQYLEAFYKAKKRIKDGDIYEVNLSYPLKYDFEGSELGLYSAMKNRGPVPFGAFIKLDDMHICSSSPERFLAKKGSKVWTQPIKGTIPNTGKELKSEAFKELLSEKNKAENLMIVDLVRNDLNRVAKVGSVQVKDLFEIQSFETVHQLVSTVECEVKPTMDVLDIIKSCFPMGSMTGAPKISAMKIIEELEWYRRGVYSGAIGYINPNDDFDFNVVIRTAIIENQQLIYPVGGAITSDSELESEWEETLVKSMALIETQLNK